MVFRSEIKVFSVSILTIDWDSWFTYVCFGNEAKIKIVFVSPYPTDPKKLPLPKKILLQFFIQDFFFCYC